MSFPWPYALARFSMHRISFPKTAPNFKMRPWTRSWRKDAHDHTQSGSPATNGEVQRRMLDEALPLSASRMAAMPVKQASQFSGTSRSCGSIPDQMQNRVSRSRTCHYQLLEGATNPFAQWVNHGWQFTTCGIAMLSDVAKFFDIWGRASPSVYNLFSIRSLTLKPKIQRLEVPTSCFVTSCVSCVYHLVSMFTCAAHGRSGAMTEGQLASCTPFDIC